MEDYVTFEIAKKLKEKGFPQKCFGKYDMVGPTYTEEGQLYKNGGITEVDTAYSAPTIPEVLNWLRKERNLHIVVDITNYGFISSTISFKWDEGYCENEIEHYDHEGYYTYEESALVEIGYVLNNLI